MNYEENLTYDWFRQLNEDEPTTPAPVDAATAIVNRALITARMNNWTYGLAKPPSDLPVGAPAVSDCTGFVMWAWGADTHKRMSDVATRVTYPEPGAAFWWDPQPGHKYGHAGIIVAVRGNDFDTVDCGESAGGIRYKQNAKAFWSGPGSAGGYENLEFWRPSTVPPNPGNPESFAGGGVVGGSSTSDESWKAPFRKFLNALGVNENKGFSIYDWKDYKREIILESKIRIGKKFTVVNKSQNEDIEKNKKILFSMLKYYDDKLQFDLPVKIIFKDDRDNSQKPLGKTGYYHPDESSITIFTTNRLLKDILRSVGHELIHHKQHCLHPFENYETNEGYAQKDKRLRRKEKEAYLFGNMLFRDFEDNYKTKYKGVF